MLTLANPDTWTGPYPTAADAEFDRWRSGLTSSAQELRGEAARWRQTANHVDDLADAGAATGVAS